MFELRIVAVAGLLALLSAPAFAQCPDGTPPPCARAMPAVALSQRAAPALNDRTWIVVPFDNVTRGLELEWLRDASVNLMYLDMSRWKDIHVIDDERVHDLIREAQGVRAASTTSLQTGIDVAKRAGAGRLVMGDVIKLGNRIQLVGKVFDVRTNQRVRTVRRATTATDSLMPAFASMAQEILSSTGTRSAEATGAGTTSLSAYEEYVRGSRFLRDDILDSARGECQD